MTNKKWTIASALLLISTLVVPAFADSNNNRAEELRAEADRIELAEKRAEYTTELVRSVLADADARTMMQGNGSPVTVNVHGFVQSRYSYLSNGDDDALRGFSIPRTRLILSGDIYNWNYEVSGQWNDSGEMELIDAYVEGGLFGGTIRVGQFKSPFMSEVLVSDAGTLAIERSIVSNQFGQGRSQGVQLGYRTSLGDVRVAYTDGFNSANGAGVQNGYAFTGRLDVHATDWLGLGFAVSHNDRVDSDYNTWTVDAAFGLGGFDFTGAYVATMDDVNGDDWGTVWTASYQCTDKMQGFVQYEMGHLEGGDTDLSIATVGVNYAINENVMWTTDIGYAVNDITADWNRSNTGWGAVSSGETLVRTQLQIKF